MGEEELNKTEEQEEEEKKLAPTWGLEEVGPCRVKLKIEVAGDRVKQLLLDRFKEFNESVVIPGFRRGHAPQPLLERKFGKALREDLKNELLQKSYEEAREAAQISPVGEPEIDREKIDLKDDQPFGYELVVEILPKIEVKAYKDLEIQKPAVEVTAAEVDEAIQDLREAKGEWAPAEEGRCREGDQIIADFVIHSDGKTGDTAENVTIHLGPGVQLYGMRMPEYYKAFEGKAAGEVVDHPVEFPADHRHKDFAGKTVTLQATIKGIKRKHLPELDEKFLRAMDMDNVDELKGWMNKQVQRRKESAIEDQLKDALVDLLVDRNPFDLPDKLIQEAGSDILNRLRVNLVMRGMPEAEVEKAVEEQKDKLKDAGVRSLRAYFLMDSVGSQERLYVTEDMVDERIAQVAQQHGKWPHEMREYLEQSGLLSQMRREMRAELVRDFLYKNAKITEAVKAS